MVPEPVNRHKRRKLIAQLKKQVAQKRVERKRDDLKRQERAQKRARALSGWKGENVMSDSHREALAVMDSRAEGQS